MRLGQPATLSGGEAERIKLSSELDGAFRASRSADQRPMESGRSPMGSSA